MNEISERLALLRAAAMALGLAVLYGGITALAVWLLDGDSPVFYGGLAAGGTVTLAAVCLAAIWNIFERDDHPSYKPIGILGIARIGVGVLACLILISPLVILTGGQLARWLEGDPEKNQLQEE